MHLDELLINNSSDDLEYIVAQLLILIHEKKYILYMCNIVHSCMLLTFLNNLQNII
jgi:hypothetical protein